jgi:small-conductance mechanosensitive channel
MTKTTPKKPDPVVGDRVQLKGRTPIGKVRQINTNKWTIVDWENYITGPMIVHLKELEKIE